MAASFRDNRQLQQYILSNITTTGVVLGTGSYGSVLEVKYGSLKCAAKKMHDILLQQDNEGVESVVAKYLQECQLMASLRHPNITQFLGICFLPDSQLPLLVMEQLDMSLDDLLEHVPGLTLFLKLSFLENVCDGLDYLHSRQPQIIHRDLTATNVLLDSHFIAKISDMGNSRIVSMRPGQLVRTLSQLPGTLVYMPPEALSDDHRYGPSLDIFSYGHLALFTLTQKFPGDLRSPTYLEGKLLLARSEVERREVYIQKLKDIVGSTRPRLLHLVRQCLDNVPENRPSSKDILATIHAVKVCVENEDGAGVMKQLDIGKVFVIKELRMKDRKIAELEKSKQSADDEIRLLRSQLETKEEELQQMVQKHGQMFQRTVEEMHQNEELMQHKEKELCSYKKFQQLQLPLNLKWVQGPDMPFGMDDYVQAVVVLETVYVGGGHAAYGSNNNYVVMAYNTHSSNWNQLPLYISSYFAMVNIKNKLVVIGGYDRHGASTNQVGVWKSCDRMWTHPYSPMPTALSSSSAAVYKQWLIVAGGYSGGHLVSTVEVLNVDSNQWHSAPSTPTLWSDMKTVVIGDTWYLMGGHTNGDDDQVYSVSLPALISQNNCRDSPYQVWNAISGLRHRWCSPLSVGGELLAVGGKSVKNRSAVSAIHHYVHETGKWVVVGHLPLPRSSFACMLTSDGKIFIVGGYSRLSTMYMGSLIGNFPEIYIAK